MAVKLTALKFGKCERQGTYSQECDIHVGRKDQ